MAQDGIGGSTARRPGRAGTASHMLAPLLVALIAAPSGFATSPSDPYDLTDLHYATDGDVLVVEARTAAPLAANATLTVIVWFGDEGAMEPEEWYILQRGPGGDLVLAGHAADQPVVAIWDNATFAVTIHRDQSSRGDCTFAAARITTWDGGLVVHDRSPDDLARLEDGWTYPHGCAPVGEAAGDATAPGKESPGFWVGMTLIALFVVVLGRR